MPVDRVITTAEIDAWPPDFANQVLDVPQWLVALALPRQEKCLVEELRHLGIPGMIFLERRSRHYRCKGTQEFTIPLFGGYVFLGAERGQRETIFATLRTTRVIAVADNVRLGQDLDALARLVQYAPEALRLRHHLVPGVRVQVMIGLFAGCYGVVMPGDGSNQADELVVNLEFAGLSVAAPLSSWVVQAV